MRNLNSIISILNNLLTVILLTPILIFVYTIKIIIQTIESFWKNN